MLLCPIKWVKLLLGEYTIENAFLGNDNISLGKFFYKKLSVSHRAFIPS